MRTWWWLLLSAWLACGCSRDQSAVPSKSTDPTGEVAPPGGAVLELKTMTLSIETKPPDGYHLQIRGARPDGSRIEPVHLNPGSTFSGKFESLPRHRWRDAVDLEVRWCKGMGKESVVSQWAAVEIRKEEAKKNP